MKKEKKKIDLLMIIRESCLVAGFFMLGFGIWTLFPPAAFIICGVLLMWVGFPREPTKGGD